MKLAFYAPMKPPSHATPSGDRLIARLFMEALRRAGFRPALASRFRSWEGKGDERRQAQLRRAGARTAERALARYRTLAPSARPRCWFTYHLYHKAPDWLGPRVCDALNIPYVVAEASLAPKRAVGPWREGYAAARSAVRRADLVVALNSIDLPCVADALDDPKRLVHLAPFLDLSRFEEGADRTGLRYRFAARFGIDSNRSWLIAVAMMREGNKLDSYRVLASALRLSTDPSWHLIVVGDGPVRRAVEAAFAGLDDRVTFAGLLDNASLPALLSACDLFVWPAVDEPLGMAMLEAQAAGLPVLAGDSGGVSDIVRDGVTGRLLSPGDAAAFAGALSDLLSNPPERQLMGRRASELAARHHAIEAAAESLAGWLTPLATGRIN